MNNSYRYFENTSCAAYPCHKIDGSGEMNCLFCYCPLYSDIKCPGNYEILESGIKDCSICTWIHDSNNHDKIIKLINKKINKEAQARLPLLTRIRTDIQPKSAGGL